MQSNFRAKALPLLVLGFLCISYAASYGQISEGGRPLSYDLGVNPEIAEVELPALNVDSILEVDAMEQAEGLPFRFGIAIPVDLTLENSGTWDTLESGYLWRLRIVTQGARTININYAAFELPVGGKFFIYNPNDTMHVIGAFTHNNNKNEGTFATGIVRANEVILEYFEPLGASKGTIEISSIVHGYRGIAPVDKNFGDALPCHINTSCPEADGWREQVRAVILFTVKGNTRFCSGVTINNVNEDLTPYILTAAHCLTAQDTLSDWIFYFNYEPRIVDSLTFDCDSTHDGTLNQSLQGATLKARIEQIDGADNMLLLLDDNVPLAYNPYFAGWSSDTTPPTATVSIHHPMGDVKKISFDDSNAIPWFSTYYRWRTAYRLTSGQTGIVEGGSSGAPLFDDDKRVIGNHSTAFPNDSTICDSSRQTGYFGSFKRAWNYYSNSNLQLKYWLDPDTTNVVGIDGFDPNETCCAGVRGNVNMSGGITVADLTFLVQYLFNQGAAPSCTEEANVNGDANENVTVADLTYLVQYLFNSGPNPPSCP